MSGVFVEPAMSDDATRRVRPVEKPPTFGEQFGANWRLNQDDDEAVAESNRIRSYNAVEDSLVALGYPRARYNNPAWSTWLVKAERSPQRFDTIWRDLQAARAKSPKHFTDVPKTREDFDRWAYGRRGERVRDQATSEAGNSTTAFLAPMIGSGVLDSLQPENLPAMAMGGGAKTVVGIAARGTLANTIAAVPTAIETAQTRTKMGEDYTANQGITDILTQGLIGGALDVGLHVGARAIPKAVDAVAPGYRAGRALDAETLAGASDAEVAEHFRTVVPDAIRTPDEKAALHIITREAEVRGSSPYVPTPTGMDAHADRLQAALDAVMASGRRTGAPAYGKRPLDGVLTDALDKGTPSMAPRVPRGNASIDGGIVKFFTDKGYSPAQARGIAAGIEAESRSDHTIRGGYQGRALGLGQWLGPRRDAIIREYGPNPTREQQLEFLHRELQGGDKGGKAVLAARTEQEVLDAYIGVTRKDGTGRGFMRPLEGEQRDGDIARGMAALGREREALPEGGAGITDDAGGIVRDPDLDAPRPEFVARDADIDAPEPPQLRRDLFPDDASHAAAQAAHDAEWRGEAPVRAAAMDAGPRMATIDEPVPAQIEKLWQADADAGLPSAPMFVLRSLGGEQPVGYPLGWSHRLEDMQTIAEQTGGRHEIVQVDPQLHGYDGSPRAIAAEGSTERDWTASIAGTRKWVVANRLTPALKAKGYEIALTPKRYGEIRQRWMDANRWVDGRPPVTPVASPADVAVARAASSRFDDPAGTEAKAQADGLSHDLRGSIERGEIGEVPLAVSGVAMADGAVAPITQTAKAMLDDLDAEDAALAAIRGCL